MAEYAFVAIRPVQIEELRKRGWKRTAAALEALKAEPARAIGSIQILITVGGLLLGIFGEPVLAEVIEHLFKGVVDTSQGAWRVVSSVVAIIVVTYLTVVFSELLPKAMTLRYAGHIAKLTAFPTFLVYRSTVPFVWLMNRTADLVTVPLGLGKVEDMEGGAAHSPEEIRLMTREAADEGSLSSQERSLILNTLSLGRRKAKQIMVPRVRVAYLDLQRSMEENRKVMNEHLYSRLPLCDGGMDNVVGVVHTKEFLSAYNAEGDSSVLGLIARPAVFVPESISLDQLLIRFDQEKSQLAFLVDEHGGVEGIVTLRDVVDELVGEPMEREELEEGAAGDKRKKNRLLLPGDVPLHEVREMLEKPEWAAEETVVTVGGLVASHLGRIPRPGEEVEVEGVRVRVLEADVRAVRKVSVMVVGGGGGGE
jgi:putative hemolysin